MNVTMGVCGVSLYISDKCFISIPPDILKFLGGNIEKWVTQQNEKV